jgi:sodium transport system ATP-binding protein
MIHASRLRKTFEDLRRGEIVAVDDVSFEAFDGEIFGLLGPNGAGKTTILRILSTVLRPTAGSARVAGHDVLAEPEAVRRGIGFVSMNTGMYDRMSAVEMVEYFGRLHGMEPTALAERIETLFDRLQMNDFRDRMGGKLSTGMKQKVSLARAIVHDPPVLIFDEPTTGLDVLVSRAVLEFIASCRRPGRCVIFSTHIMHEAQRLCDRLCILHRGRVLAGGTLADLRQASGKDDLEDIFFEMISEEDIRAAVGEGSRHAVGGGSP